MNQSELIPSNSGTKLFNTIKNTNLSVNTLDNPFTPLENCNILKLQHSLNIIIKEFNDLTDQKVNSLKSEINSRINLLLVNKPLNNEQKKSFKTSTEMH